MGLKGLHKNVWSTEKDDGTVTVAAAAPRDSTRLIAAKTTRPVEHKGSTKDRSRIVKPGAAIALQPTDKLDKTLKRSMRCPSYRSNEIHTMEEVKIIFYKSFKTLNKF